MAYALGWKDILRPIRDGYRHLFPTPDTGPTPEERSKRRAQDRLKGFNYFDTFEQLESWTAHDADPLQRANTPLLRRCIYVEDRTNKANVMLCHDYAGNYHEYESVAEPEVNEEMYACEYLQYVETFVYFSHKLVCVPPPTWTNTLHRNGVKVLGTFILEPQAKETERLLQHTGAGADRKFSLAKVLADIAKHYGFDGYLVNIEKPFPKDTWISYLQAFLVQLRQELGSDRELLWYDALTKSNRISYQNALTPYNIPFAEACGSILTNYCWDESKVTDSSLYAARSGFRKEKVYFGIDLFAQGGKRKTYPKDRGGGTNTGIAVAKLAEMGMSACLFAPAWSFEHFHNHGREIEKVIWEGKKLPIGIECPCKDGAQPHQPLVGSSVVEYATRFPAGSDTFFFTDFARASSSSSKEDAQSVDGSTTLNAHLASQSILPLPVPPKDRQRAAQLIHRSIESSGQSTLLIEAHQDASKKEALGVSDNLQLSLYEFNVPANGTLRLEVACKNLTPERGEATMYLKFLDTRELQLLPIDRINAVTTISVIIGTPDLADHRLHEIGVQFRGTIEGEVVSVSEMFSISILPLHYQDFVRQCSIGNIRIERRCPGDNAHDRVCWSYTHERQELQAGIPYSAITGPFSYFLVTFDSVQIGRAYALERIVKQHILEERAGKEVEVKVTGVGFDGRTLASMTSILRIASV